MRRKLFADSELRTWLIEQIEEVKRYVGTLPPDEIRFSPEAVADSVFGAAAITPLTLHVDQLTRSELTEVRNGGLTGMTIKFYLPYSGSKRLLLLKASSYRGDIVADATDDAIVFEIGESGRTLTSEIIDARVQAVLKNLHDHVEWTNADVAQHNESLRRVIENSVTQRKQHLDEIATLSASLTIPVRPTATKSQIHVPVARKTVRLVDQGGRGSAGVAEEPSLQEAMYEDILRTLSHVSRAMERLPGTAAKFEEEEFRDLLLFVLNANYGGLARGEVFNTVGKTDILLPYRDRNAFIAECKVWRGPKKFTEAIDQLLSYVAWRDTKGALLLFIKSGNPSNIIGKSTSALESHRARKVTKPSEEPEVRQDFLFESLIDSNRRIQVAFLPIVLMRAGSAHGTT